MKGEYTMKLSLFQVIIIVLGILLLIFIYQEKDVGRYQMTELGNSITVIDTKTDRYFVHSLSESPIGLDFDSMYVKATNFWKKDK